MMDGKSAVEVLATLDWYGHRDSPQDVLIRSIQEVVAQLHGEDPNGVHEEGFCRACAENYLACNILAGKLDF